MNAFITLVLPPQAIPHSRLWIIPGGGHGPVLGERWPEFLKTAAAFLNE